MKRIYGMALIAGMLLAGCGQSETEAVLNDYGIKDIKTCDNLEAIQQAGDDIVKDKGSVYCAIEAKQHLDQATAFVKRGYTAKRIDAFLQLPYYHKELTERYIAYDDGKKQAEEIVTEVNIGLDQPYFTNVDVIEDTEDILLLVNKYHRLPDAYEPKDLVKTPNACEIGKDYSCQSEEQYLRREAADAFSKLVKAAQQEGIDIKAIASYRSFVYQKNLYDYYAQHEGKEYADIYYARPGHSEHNTALAIDVTIGEENFNEIENVVQYEWLLSHMADYGFILRYPKDKTAITGYQYESWHLRYVGIQAAQFMTKEGLTLDEYIARKDMQE